MTRSSPRKRAIIKLGHHTVTFYRFGFFFFYVRATSSVPTCIYYIIGLPINAQHDYYYYYYFRDKTICTRASYDVACETTVTPGRSGKCACVPCLSRYRCTGITIHACAMPERNNRKTKKKKKPSESHKNCGAAGARALDYSTIRIYPRAPPLCRDRGGWASAGRNSSALATVRAREEPRCWGTHGKQRKSHIRDFGGGCIRGKRENVQGSSEPR